MRPDALHQIIKVNAKSHPAIIGHLICRYISMYFMVSARSPPPVPQQEPARCTSIFNPISIPRAAPVPVRGTATCSLCEHAYNPDALFSYLSSSRI